MNELKILTEKEVSIKYSVSQRTLSNLRKSGKIPYSEVWFYVGKQIRYKAQPLQNYFESDTTII
ncbi:MAG: helix-turn-helix domain-containing protein [Flavobacteriales bacterium]